MSVGSVRVTFEYASTQPDELDLKVGEIVTGVDTSVEGGWWEGVHPSGKKGWFPDNFVEKIKPPPPAAAKSPAPAKPPAPVAPAPAQPPAPSGGKKCKCTFAYQAQSDDELTINPGDIIAITKQDEEGWWEGILNGKSGVFPNNFVEEIPGGAPTPAPAAAAPPPAAPENNGGGDDEAKPKKVEKVGFGNIFAGGGVPQLRKTGTFSGQKPDFLNNKKPRPAGVDPQKLDLVKVEFNYTAENSDELNLKKGEFVVVTKREDEGWWEGELVGTKKSGLFPDNFVVPASDSEKAEQAAIMSPGAAAAAPTPSAPPAAEPAPPRPAAVKPKAEAPPPTANKVAAKPPPPVAVKTEAPPPAAKKPPPVSMKKKPPAVSMKKPAAKKPPATTPAPAATPPPAVEKKAAAPPPAATATVTDEKAAKAAAAAQKAADDAMAMAKKAMEELDAMTKSFEKHTKQIKMLMSDLDEERGQRAKMQIEIDRLKKLAEI